MVKGVLLFVYFLSIRIKTAYTYRIVFTISAYQSAEMSITCCSIRVEKGAEGGQRRLCGQIRERVRARPASDKLV